mmetsp:Transcript_13301/g.37578  ORF Transcript_13301/g.37578 Transcript_13301/m.37578 type:complete len:330 (+) Transcript_13301:1413-2402(+)
MDLAKGRLQGASLAQGRLVGYSRGWHVAPRRLGQLNMNTAGRYTTRGGDLVEELLGVCNAKRHRCHRQAPLAEAVLGVELLHRGLAGLKAAKLAEALVPACLHLVVHDLLAVVSAVTVPVEVELPDGLGRLVYFPGDAVDDVLHCHDGLRPSKATKSRIRRLVGLAQMPIDPGVWDLVGIVDAHHAGLHDKGAQVQAVARVLVHVAVKSHQFALLCEAHLVLAEVGVPLSGGLHVLVTVHHQAHRPSGVVGCHCGRKVWDHCAGLLPSKAAPKPLCLADHLVGSNAEDLGGVQLVFVGVLGGGDDEVLVVLSRDDCACLRLQVEVLLPS